MDIKAIIFDFDGVIAETESIHRQSWLALQQDLSRPLPDGFLDRGVGSTLDKLCWELFEFWDGYVPLQDIYEGKAAQFRDLIAGGGDVLVPGVLEAFQRLSSMGYPLAIATSSPRSEIQTLLDAHGVTSMFTSIVTLDMVSQAKPDPETYLVSARNLGVPPENCLVFEDSIVGVTAARKAGMNVVGVLTSFKQEDLEPLIHSIVDFHQLSQVIQKFLN